ncbi:MAG: hypothetical protein F6K41_18415 [Symploca sp. SIO3E6]|nr:hypothetical protein [Caldora sp. SIO3E6]
MAQSNILELAKQGDPNAIATLLNRSLQAQGITAKVKLKGDCLRVMLEGTQMLNQQKMAQFVHQGMLKLGAESIKTVKIYGKQAGQDFPLWNQELDLATKRQLITDNHSHAQPTPTNLSINSSLKSANPESVNQETSPVKQNSIEDYSSKSNRQADNLDQRIHRVLISSLGFRISFDILFLLYALVWSTSYYIYDLLDIADTTGFVSYLMHKLVVAIDFLWNPLDIVSTWIYRLTVVIMLIWLYQLHASLRNHWGKYSISPWGAIARFAIPFYSLWGIWNIFTTLAHQFKSQGGEFINKGESLKSWVLCFYFALFGANICNAIYWFYDGNAETREFLPWLFLSKNATGLLLSIVLLRIVLIARKGVAQIFSNQCSV